MINRFRASVTGSYPRPVLPTGTLNKPMLSHEEADEIIRWAEHDQVDAGLDVITDGQGLKLMNAAGPRTHTTRR